MDSQNRRTECRSHFFAWVLVALILLTVLPGIGVAKSLYVIAENVGDYRKVPIQAYDIGPDGQMTFQTEHEIPYYAAGAVGLAVDSDTDSLFITFDMGNRIQVLDATTMTEIGLVRAPGADNLAGIVYDHDKGLLYCVDRDTGNMYCYTWEPETASLRSVMGSPFELEGAEAYGIALDEINDLLYVGGITRDVRVYDTSDWSLVDIISVSEMALSIAVDAERGYLYAGAGYATNRHLLQYNLNTGEEKVIYVDEKGGVIGITVNALTGYVYISTGVDNQTGGDDLMVYDSSLELLQVIEDMGNPTGIAIPGGHTSYNPLSLDKVVANADEWETGNGRRPIIPIGTEFTYSVSFDPNEYEVTGVTLVDTLPQEVSFVRADGEGAYGYYDPNRHVYVWENPPLSGSGRTSLDITVHLDADTRPNKVFVNRVTIYADPFPQTTVGVEAIAAEGMDNPLTVSKRVVTDGSHTGTIHVNAGDQVTYEICITNADSKQEFTTVTVTDILPDQAIFVRADGDGVYGAYDSISHTYTWSFDSLLPGQTECVQIVVQLSKNIPPSTTITNTAIVNSEEGPSDSNDVDIVVGYSPLGLSKTVVDDKSDDTATDGPVYAEPGDEVTYEISFDNLENDLTVHNTVIIDSLPEEVTFVSADGDGTYGGYDPASHTYTWTYSWFSPGASDSVQIVVRLNEDIASGTVITNTAIIDSDETPSTTAGADLTVGGDILRFSKLVVDGTCVDPDQKDLPCVAPDTDVTYALCFENASDEPLTHLAIIDMLPEQMSFVTADGDGDTGYYDESTHTYTWFYGELETKASACLEIVLHVEDKVSSGVVITNVATIQGKQVPETMAQVDVITTGGSDGNQVDADMVIRPSRIYRSGTSDSTSVMALLSLPEGIGKESIAADIPLVLYPGEIEAHTQTVYGNDDQGRIAAYFDTDALLAATEGYGVFEIRVGGGLYTGQTFMGTGTINILKFGGP